MELLATRRAKHGATFTQDAADVARPQLDEGVVEQTSVTALDTDDVRTRRPTDQRRGADRRIHARCITTARHHRDAFHGADATVA